MHAALNVSPLSRFALVLALASSAISASAQLTDSVVIGGAPAAAATVVDFGTPVLTNDQTAVVTNLPATVYGNAIFSGGNFYDTSLTAGGISGVAARPAGSSGNFWAIEPGQTGSVSFSTPVTYFGFLWGSPDPGTWNQLTFTLNNGQHVTYDGSVINLSNAWTNSAYFSVSATAGTTITGVTLTASTPAFETADFSYIAAVPEPESYAMLLAGLGLVGLIARRRRRT